MSSPPRDSNVAPSSSPSGSSPVLRRRESLNPVSPIIYDPTERPRLSPTLSRSYDTNDPQALERQRTMDVDMALQLSRARRETVTSPVSPVVSSSPEQVYASISALSESEQRDIDVARGEVREGDISVDMIERVDEEETLHPDLQRQPSFLQNLHQTQDPSLLVSLNRDHSSSVLDEHPSAAFGPLPTYQQNVTRSNFDFSEMEEFAAKEKTDLGLSSPTARFNLDSLRLDRGDGFTTPAGEGASSPQSILKSARQRRLSQSTPAPRTHRKGVGGKMALFENNNDNSFLPGRLSVILGGQAPSGSATSLEQSTSAAILGASASAPGLPTGILATGHDRPYRFSFYSNGLSATIHARSLSELPAENQSFEDLFSGIGSRQNTMPETHLPNGTSPTPKDRPVSSSSFAADAKRPAIHSQRLGGDPRRPGLATNDDYDGHTWWLDINSPTDEEMKMLSKVFGIHPLTTEDIQMEETREKIELFRNYYFVCFRSFDQDQYSPTHLEPLNMYIIVFREGILSFHFRPTPHPQNVRRRIKQLKDYINVTSDWISYALIDDITDAFGPLIQSIEYEVDSIDELVLILKEAEQTDMLRRIGTCRKKVMGLLRLMGNKADVVKGLAKRCNENWRVAPTSDIGLYLSDIQDHLITMTQSLNHYEKILSRSHSNYLAQISIEMTDANNQINDVLSKLTALGTVLIPMNLVTGLWGMNVHVPGQDVDNLRWFASIIACLAAFAFIGGYSTYRFMADLRTFAALGCYGASAITALTAQNTIGVQGVHAIPASFVSSQLTSVLSDVEIHAMKTGMLFDASIIQAVTESLKTQYEGQKRPPLVCDPVCVSTSGHTLLQSDAIGVLISDLFPMSTLITPNKSEAELLLGHKHGPYTISSLEDMIVAARRLLEFGSSASLVKGGHITVTLQEIEKVAADSMDIVVYRDGMMEDNMEILQVDWTAPPRLVVDVLCEDNSQTVSLFVRPYIDSKNTHGTGCTLSAAIAARLGNGDTLIKAVRAATIYTHLGLEAALPIGQGHGPLNHLHSNLQLSLPRQTPSNPYPFARYLIHRSRKIWKQYVEHDFVRLLGKGVLRREAFVFFIKQDYHYLKYYARAYGLMAGKATKYSVIESSASIIFNIVNETATHKSLCADFGVSAEELEATPLAQSTISYGSYLIDVAVQGDVAQLSMAVLACLLGYGEVGLWLKKESLKPDSWVQLTGNPFLRWIEDYSGEAYQNAVKSGLAAIEAQASHDPPSPARLEEWYDVWERCAWLEKGFWDAAMAIVPSE